MKGPADTEKNFIFMNIKIFVNNPLKKVVQILSPPCGSPGRPKTEKLNTNNSGAYSEERFPTLEELRKSDF